ncbi:efflux RND transporter periplasmic adaptor subunit [Sediminicoccus rosea]|jgi:RND family efflux transporter MFP subunit|uniref:Efflux RND transporter periplasmic adaptor subunit n=1 Tax=Sediminicoccus rosea TaxID=1225128 RepID=A0ABZ0PLT8_9PROT|nr:efflux RND transporter periplasmic adaptor subunit [Sediminicoccus rosea]WPB86679.1 efflux RND transporter periplasmic adaptor subunit [Sediminicoccus rosea]
MPLPPPLGHALRALPLALLVLAGCEDAAPPPAPEIRPVRVVAAERSAGGDVASLTGTVQAETEVNLAFRIDGRMVERLVNVGDAVRPGQVVARLNRDNEENGLRAARANLVAARGQLREAENNYWRQGQLLREGFTTRVRFDQAAQQLQTIRAAVDAAEAQVSIAETRLGYTELVSDVAGRVTQRGAEPGEVVQPGRMILRIARSEGRDAVFDVPATLKDQAPANPLIEVNITGQPQIRAQGRVREVSPQADPVTGTFQVRVGLAEPPPEMRLGSTVTGSLRLGATPGISIPASALTRAERGPAVWVVDPASETVSLRAVELVRHDPGHVVVGQGLQPGDLVVTAGVQTLRPGQKVRLLR